MPTLYAQPEGVSFGLNADTRDGDVEWTRIDGDYIVQGYTISRGRSYELDRITTGTATIQIVDTDGSFDPTNTFAAFYGKIHPLTQAAIALQNPVTSGWQTLFRGFVSSVQWVPHVTERHANVTIELVDALALFSAAEMDATGAWGNSVDEGNVFFDEDLTPDAVQTRIGLVLDQYEWPSNGTGTDGVTNGTTTFTAASGGFGVEDVGKFISIQGKGRYQIVARASSTSVTLSGSPSAGTSLPWTYGLRRLHSGNVKLWSTTYAPRTTCLNPILDCADAEFPFGVSVFYVTRHGIVTFHGRQARFNVSNPDYHVQAWDAGDRAYVAVSSATVVPLVPPLAISRDDTNIYNRATATRKDIADVDIPGQTTEAPTSVAAYGARSWSAEDLLTAGGAGTTAEEETLKFANYVTDNYSQPVTRVGQVTIKTQDPAGSSGAATWGLLTEIDLNDVVTLGTTHAWAGGGLGDDFFVEGVHYDVKPMQPGYHEVVLTLDLSPRSLFPIGYF